MFEADARSVIWGLSPMLFIVGCVSHIVSIATPHWSANTTSHLGLWTFCNKGEQCISISEALTEGAHSWYRAVQGLEIVATVFVLASIVTGLMRVNLGQSIWQTACGASAFSAGVFDITGSLVFSKNHYGIQLQDQTLSWAFVFNIISGSLTLMAGPILIVDSIRHKY